MSGEGPEFVDTNVFIYAHDTSAGPKGEEARELIDRLWEEGTGRVSVQVLQEFYVTATRQLKRVLAPEAAAATVSDLSSWRVHCPTAEDVRAAIHVQREHQISFWDAMILHSAAELGCRTAWSEDLNDGQEYGAVVVRSPFS